MKKHTPSTDPPAENNIGITQCVGDVPICVENVTEGVSVASFAFKLKHPLPCITNCSWLGL